MEYTRITWNENHKMLRQLLKKESTFKDAISLFMDKHAKRKGFRMVNSK